MLTTLMEVEGRHDPIAQLEATFVGFDESRDYPLAEGSAVDVAAGDEEPEWFEAAGNVVLKPDPLLHQLLP